MSLIPPIGTSGIYTLLTPFNTKLVSNLVYTCTALRSLTELIASDIDPLQEYYTANNLDKNQLQIDVNNNECIVTLQSSKGELVYVPSSFITSYPDMCGVPYTGTAIVVKLGPVPDDMNLDYLQSKLIATVADVIGVDATTSEIVTTSTLMISYDQDKLLANARATKVSSSGTDYAKLLAMTAQRDSLANRIALLEAFIIKNGNLVQQDGSIAVQT